MYMLEGDMGIWFSMSASCKFLFYFSPTLTLASSNNSINIIHDKFHLGHIGFKVLPVI